MVNWSSIGGEKIEINKDNVGEVKQKLAREEKSIESAIHSRPELLQAANKFFFSLTSQAESLFKQNKLQSIGFGYHSPEFYLLSFELPKDRLPPSRADEFDRIIHVFQNPTGDLQLEVVGGGILSSNPEDFAAKVYREILFIVDRAFQDAAPPGKSKQIPEKPGD